MPPLQTWLHWLDAEPLRYWVPAWTCFAAACLGAVLAPDPAPAGRARRWLSHGGFALAILATLAAFRWPAWFNPDQFNPDESLVIAGAITLKVHPLYWGSVDGGTHGPIAEYLLVFASWLGAPLNHATARVVAIALQALALIATWRSLRSLASERVARCGVLPGLAFWSFTTWVDFIHYGMELPAITLVSLAGWAVIRPLVSDPGGRFPLVRLGLGGLALGAVPLTKLQLVPLGAFLGLVVIAVLGFNWWRTRQPVFRRALLVFLGGVLLPLVGLLAYLWVFGLADQFWRAYILSALDYSASGHHFFGEMPSWFFHFSATTFEFAWFFWGGLAFALLYARDRCPPVLRLARGLAWGALAIAMFCVLRPNREVVHYLHILVIPLTLLGGLTLAGALAEPPPEKLARWWPFAALAALAVIPQVHFRAMSWNPYVGFVRDYLAKPRSAAAQYILQHRSGGDALAMWGWEPSLFVETGMAQGTREAASVYQLTQWPLQGFYVDRYQRDLLTLKPAWFVDAVGPGAFAYEDRATSGHETVAAIRDIVARDYELAADLDAKRIYRLKAQPAPTTR